MLEPKTLREAIKRHDPEDFRAVCKKTREICKSVLQSESVQNIYCSNKDKTWERGSKDFSRQFSAFNGGRSSSKSSNYDKYRDGHKNMKNHYKNYDKDQDYQSD